MRGVPRLNGQASGNAALTRHAIYLSSWIVECEMGIVQLTKDFASRGVLLLLVLYTMVALPCFAIVGEPSGAVLSPVQTAGVPVESTSLLQPETTQQALEQARKMLRDQADMLRTMQREIERQGKEIEALQQAGLPSQSGVSDSSSYDAGANAARLQSAVQTLRTPAAVTSDQSSIAKESPLNKIPARETPADLYFRIGNAVFTPSGWVDFTGYFRSTDVGSGLGTNFQSIPFNNTSLGGLSETRLTAQSSRFAFRVDEDFARIHAYGYLEADFNGYLPGNGYSNSLRMRAYYLNLARGKWEIPWRPGMVSTDANAEGPLPVLDRPVHYVSPRYQLSGGLGLCEAGAVQVCLSSYQVLGCRPFH